MRIIVCGGRDHADSLHVARVLDRLHEQRGIELLVHGGARGADTLAANWARSRGVPAARVEAEWHKQGRGAGIIRNARMLQVYRPDCVVAFPGGRGTADMVNRARADGVPVMECGNSL